MSNQVFSLQSSVFSLRSSVFSLPTSDFCLRSSNLCLLTSVFLLFLFSCKAPKEVVKVKLEHYSTKELLEKLDSNEIKFESLSTKADITVFDEKETSFKAHLRIKKDSAIWISITPALGIEMARVLITKDTVMFMDRIHNKYFVGDFAFINKSFNVELDYNMLEALLVGNSIDFEKNEKIKTAIDRQKDFYFIGTERKRKVKKDIKKDIKKDKEVIKNQTQILWIYPESFKIAELMLKDPEKDQSLQGVFSEHKLVNEQLFPFKLNFMVESKKNLKIDVEYGKITLNNTLNFSFKIPEKYEQIQ